MVEKNGAGFRMSRWLAGRLMYELGLTSCQQPIHRDKYSGHEHIVITNHLFATGQS